MKKIELCITLFALCFINLCEIEAVPANPNPIEAVQPDGTAVTYYIQGDERVHWMQSTDGYTLLHNDQRFIVYATLDEVGDLVPSKYVYRSEGLRSTMEKHFLEAIPKNLKFSAKQVQDKLKVWETPEQTLRSNSGEEIQKAPVVGEKTALCVLVDFSDKKINYTIEEFDGILNGATNSVKDFYHENSYGQMDLTVSVIGPYEMPETAAYYGASESRWSDFAKTAIQAADADPNVDLSQYAVDGKIETFHIIFAGYGDESIDNGEQIWSHKSQFKTLTLPNSKVKVSVYSCSPELAGASGNKLTTIGVICHELCHVFGADDFYDIDYTDSGGSYPGTGHWDLMASGSWNGPSRNGSRPAHINMFQKILYGWVTPTELTTPLSVTDMPSAGQNAEAYTLKASTNNEIYVLENRQKTGYDSHIPGSGLIIYHIHNSASNGAINNTKHPQQAYVVCASSTTAIPSSKSTSYGTVDSAGAPFASTAARSEFSGTSTPQMFKWSGSSGIAITDKPLRNITQSGGLISFCFGYLPVTNLEATIDNANIYLSWDEPTNASETTVYSYNIYVDNELVAEQITETTFDYQPEEFKTYAIAVEATVGDCHSARTTKVVEFDDPLPISGSIVALSAVQLYPNPVKDILILQFDAPVSVAIIDINGRPVYRNPEVLSLQLPVQYWDNGVYLVRIQSVAENKVIKLIKQ
ncbi:MAG: M6 family metalloprotease domain-containing protein [Candidatus Symbiothrix sp.]|jgi:M6 family metalloprotease-like protein|nr:M6 family metalloprotease domain-containing protein [Candidatus Symbiothrix sp.]